MSRTRSFFPWILLIVFAALTFLWCLYVPYAPKRLYRPIPANAAFVSQHKGLPDRWTEFYHNPLAFSLLLSTGLKPAAIRDLEVNPEVRPWFEKLASRDLVISYVPKFGSRREPVWVASSWIGGGSQRFRWQLNLGGIEGFTRSKPYRGRYYWIVDTPLLRPDYTLTISLVEGMIIACLSWHHETMEEVLDTYDGLIPSVAERGDFPKSDAWCAEANVLDRGWIDLPGLMGFRRLGSQPVVYEFSELSPAAAVGVACSPGLMSGGLAGTEPVKAGALGRVLRDAPVGVGLVQSSLLPEAKGPLWLRMFSDFVETQNADTTMVALFGNEYSGRFKGIRVPTVMAGIPVEDEGAAVSEAIGWLDRLNAHYQWGLIPHHTRVGDTTVRIVEGTGDNIYSSLRLDEKAAFAVRDGWFILSSNSDSLIRLLENAQSELPPGAESRVPWVRAIDEASAPAYAWVDAARGSRTFIIAIGAYSLKLLMQDPEKTMPLRERLNQAKRWIDALEPMGVVRVWLDAEGEDVRVRFRIGREDGVR